MTTDRRELDDFADSVKAIDRVRNIDRAVYQINKDLWTHPKGCLCPAHMMIKLKALEVAYEKSTNNIEHVCQELMTVRKQSNDKSRIIKRLKQRIRIHRVALSDAQEFLMEQDRRMKQCL